MVELVLRFYDCGAVRCVFVQVVDLILYSLYRMVVSLIEEDIFVPMGFSIVDVAERTTNIILL